jgi:hypothetical protein
MPDVGRVLIVIGLPLFKLPGDFVIKGEHLILVIPIATSIVLSILLTIALNLYMRR